MMMGVSGLMASFGDESGGGSTDVGASTSVHGGGGEESGGGSRWPRPETLALIRIRSEMDGVFRDSSLKGWEEVSRKLAEVGFQRSGKKCKEKFENVYKYHKRTKASNSEGKTYRFFDELEALENAPPPPRPQPPSAAAMAAQPTPHITVPSTSPNPNPINSSPFQISQPPPPLPPVASNSNFPASLDSSSSTSSDEDVQRRRGKKRKWKDIFNRLMEDVIQKQEDLQKKFLEALKKRERDRLQREEAWKVREVERLNRERDFLLRERSAAAAKDAAVIAFLQKVTDQNNLQIPATSNIVITPPPPPSTPPPPPPPNLQSPIAAPPTRVLHNGGRGENQNSSSRWPKAEVEALTDLRTRLDQKYQESVPKGPLWDEISAAMAERGYRRSSKRCKEKWENINKYFKKVKEGSKKRPEDSKTCPYFHQLDAIYRERAKNGGGGNGGSAAYSSDNPMAPIMAMPEQQWPLHDHDHDKGDDVDEEDEGGREGKEGGETGGDV